MQGNPVCSPARRTINEFSVSRYPERCEANRRCVSEAARRIASGETVTEFSSIVANPRRAKSYQATVVSSTLAVMAAAHSSNLAVALNVSLITFHLLDLMIALIIAETVVSLPSQ